VIRKPGPKSMSPSPPTSAKRTGSESLSPSPPTSAAGRKAGSGSRFRKIVLDNRHGEQWCHDTGKYCHGYHFQKVCTSTLSEVKPPWRCDCSHHVLNDLSWLCFRLEDDFIPRRLEKSWLQGWFHVFLT
jgi:hypothetical protein